MGWAEHFEEGEEPSSQLDCLGLPGQRDLLLAQLLARPVPLEPAHLPHQLPHQHLLHLHACLLEQAGARGHRSLPIYLGLPLGLCAQPGGEKKVGQLLLLSVLILPATFFVISNKGVETADFFLVRR